MKIVYLGDNKIGDSSDNIYHYLFNHDRVDNDNVILESDYLNDNQINIANKHLAEFSSFYVISRFNPLNFKDDDIICLISSRKFDDLTGFNKNDLFNFGSHIKTLFDKYPDSIYGFLHHNRTLGPEDYSITLEQNEKGGGLFNFKETKPLISDLYVRLDNMTPHPRRHYFCYTYKTFKLFYEWVHNNIFNIFFNEDFSEKVDENGKSLIYKTHPKKRIYENHRAFGLVVEHFHYRFYYENNVNVFWHPYKDKAPTFVYKQNYYNNELDWEIKKINL